MKTIGLIGGMSWESTVSYYRIINEEVKKRLGGLHSAKILLYSVEFDEIEKCQAKGEWEKSARILGNAAQNLEGAGADFILICTNTMHKVAPQIAAMIQVPLIHIADATAEELIQQNIHRVGLLGTKYTMTEEFYKQRLVDKGINVLIPNEEDIESINNTIFKELCLGEVNDGSRETFKIIIDKLKQEGAEGIILGCTEIGLLIHPTDVPIPVFDTTLIHAKSAVKLALDDMEDTIWK
ncbi:MAG: aspartate/glutamate racemase family protein [Longicatena sp.]